MSLMLATSTINRPLQHERAAQPTPAVSTKRPQTFQTDGVRAVIDHRGIRIQADPLTDHGAGIRMCLRDLTENHGLQEIRFNPNTGTHTAPLAYAQEINEGCRQSELLALRDMGTFLCLASDHHRNIDREPDAYEVPMKMMGPPPAAAAAAAPLLGTLASHIDLGQQLTLWDAPL